VLARSRAQWFDALMSDYIYKKIELAEVRGHLENNKVADWQVTLKIGFTLDT
jgi:Dodecin